MERGTLLSTTVPLALRSRDSGKACQLPLPGSVHCLHPTRPSGANPRRRAPGGEVSGVASTEQATFQQYCTCQGAFPRGSRGEGRCSPLCLISLLNLLMFFKRVLLSVPTPNSTEHHFSLPSGEAEGTSPPAQLALTTTGLSARPNPQAFLSTRKWELVCVRTSLTVQRHICSRIETVSALPLEQQRSLIP